MYFEATLFKASKRFIVFRSGLFKSGICWFVVVFRLLVRWFVGVMVTGMMLVVKHEHFLGVICFNPAEMVNASELLVDTIDFELILKFRFR